MTSEQKRRAASGSARTLASINKRWNTPRQSRQSLKLYKPGRKNCSQPFTWSERDVPLTTVMTQPTMVAFLAAYEPLLR